MRPAVSILLVLLAAGSLAYLAACTWRFREMVRFRSEIGARARARLRDLQQHAPAANRDDPLPSRGIVMCAGGRSLLAQAFVCLDVLRNTHGCGLPVELYFVGEAEMPEACRQSFEREFAPLRCIDAANAPPPPGQPDARTPDGYALKAFALASSTFDLVLFLDADCVPVRDPSELFEMQALKRHGNVFWPDTVLMSVLLHHPSARGHLRLRDGRTPETLQSFNPRILDYLGLAHAVTREQVRYETDSGQILLDRRRSWLSLQMTWFLNSHSRHLYQYMHGDKDSFQLGFGLAGQTFHQVEERAFQAGVVRDGSFEGKVYLQRHPDGQVLFYHQSKRKPDIDGEWQPITHCSSDPAGAHPRPRASRDASILARVEDLSELRELPQELRALEDAIASARARLLSRSEAMALPPPRRRRLLDRRLLPW